MTRSTTRAALVAALLCLVAVAPAPADGADAATAQQEASGEPTVTQDSAAASDDESPSDRDTADSRPVAAQPITAPAATAKPAGAPRAAGERDPRPVAGSVVAPVRPRRLEVGTNGTIELGRSPAPAAGRWRGEPISLSLRDAPLPEVLRTFAKIAGVNLVLDPKVQGLVTVELVDVPWDQALYVILKTHGMAAEIDGRVWVVEPD
jgi:hypothetical protein